MAHTVFISECCEADVRERETEDDVIEECVACGKPCTTREVCEFCLGTKKIEGIDSDRQPSGKFSTCQECADDTSGDNE